MRTSAVADDHGWAARLPRPAGAAGSDADGAVGPARPCAGGDGGAGVHSADPKPRRQLRRGRRGVGSRSAGRSGHRADRWAADRPASTGDRAAGFRHVVSRRAVPPAAAHMGVGPGGSAGRRRRVRRRHAPSDRADRADAVAFDGQTRTAAANRICARGNVAGAAVRDRPADRRRADRAVLGGCRGAAAAGIFCFVGVLGFISNCPLRSAPNEPRAPPPLLAALSPPTVRVIVFFHRSHGIAFGGMEVAIPASQRPRRPLAGGGRAGHLVGGSLIGGLLAAGTAATRAAAEGDQRPVRPRR